MAGHDAEYWAGTYGALWKDMELYVEKDTYSLLNDTSDWHVYNSSAIDRVDALDGHGKEFQFSFDYDTVIA